MPKKSKKSNGMARMIMGVIAHVIVAVTPLHSGDGVKGDLNIQPKIQVIINNVHNNVTIINDSSVR